MSLLRHSLHSITILAALPLINARFSTAQCAGKSDFALAACLAETRSSVKAGAPGNAAPAANAAVTGTLTTGLADAIHTDTLGPTLNPKAFKPLLKLDRANDGSFVLRRGFYDASVESYFFDNGNNGSAQTGAFFPAPIQGSRAEILAAVLKNAELHPELPQGQIQQLVSAIFAGTDLEKMPQPVQQTAVIVLPPKLAKQLQGTVQANEAGQAVMAFLNSHIGQLPSFHHSVPAAAASPATVASQPSDSDTDGTADLPVARGTWAQMPGGFYVRYLPDSVLHTRIQIMVPDAALAKADKDHPLTFDPTQYLAVLAQAPGQRLGITVRSTDIRR